jgi:hypothetical protein
MARRGFSGLRCFLGGKVDRIRPTGIHQGHLPRFLAIPNTGSLGDCNLWLWTNRRWHRVQ